MVGYYGGMSNNIPPPMPPYPVAYYPPPKPRSGWFAFGCGGVIFLVLGIAALVVFGFFAAIMEAAKEGGNDVWKKADVKEKQLHKLGKGETNAKVAVINIRGVISADKGPGIANSDQIVKLLEHARNSKTIKAVVLRVNSPGGEVTATDIIHHAVVQLKESGKPVVVCMETVAASGGYYVSAPADWIISNPTTFTGSIGVIISGINIQEGMEKLGIKQQTFTSGAFKDMLSMTRPMTEVERTYIQSMVDQTYKRFLTVVMDGRKKSKEELESSNAVDGRVLTGEDAYHAGLVDQLGYAEDAYRHAAGLVKLEAACIIVELRNETDFGDIFGDLFAEASSPKKVSLELMGGGFKLRPGVPYMLPPHYATEQ